MKLNEQLSKLLKEHKISQQSLGEALGIRQATVSSWIQGRTEPSASDICKIADYFNISADFLLGRRQQREVKKFENFKGINNFGKVVNSSQTYNDGTPTTPTQIYDADLKRCENNPISRQQVEVNGKLDRQLFGQCNGHNYEVTFEINNQCPICYAYTLPQFVWAVPVNNPTECVAFFYCCNCKKVFAVHFNKLDLYTDINVGIANNGKILISCDTNYTPYQPQIPSLPPEFDIPAFDKFRAAFRDLHKVKAFDVESLTGMAYRRAIEFLISDWLLFEGKSEEEVANTPLAALIRENIDDSDIRVLANAVNRLSTDYVHYNIKYPEYGLEDIATLFDLLPMEIAKKIKIKKAKHVEKR